MVKTQEADNVYIGTEFIICFDKMKRLLYYPFPAAILLVISAGALCSGCYTLKQGSAMLGYLNRAIPLEDLITGTNSGNSDKPAPDMALAEENRRFAMRVMDIRRFATEELGLKQNKNYTSYVELDRNYLAAVVSACAKDSFTRHEWWFPIVGKVPYKGFFNVEDARKERAKLEKKDLDVWIRAVDAFSTLGWFQDPLYSYMKNYPLKDLAELIIHEQLHATVFLKNHTQFNEELAEFVGSEGARLYMESISEREILTPENHEEIEEDRAAFLVFIRSLIADLDRMYNDENLARDEKLRLKEIMITGSQSEFEENYDEIFKTQNYRGFANLSINNAYLELYRLYYERNTWFRDIYEKSGKSLREFIDTAKTLKRKGDPGTQLVKALGLE